MSSSSAHSSICDCDHSVCEDSISDNISDSGTWGLSVQIDGAEDWWIESGVARLPMGSTASAKTILWHGDELCDTDHEAASHWESDSGTPHWGVICAGDADDTAYIGECGHDIGYFPRIQKVINGELTEIGNDFDDVDAVIGVKLSTDFTPSAEQKLYTQVGAGAWTLQVTTTDTGISSGGKNVGLWGNINGESVTLTDFAAGAIGTVNTF